MLAASRRKYCLLPPPYFKIIIKFFHLLLVLLISHISSLKVWNRKYINKIINVFGIRDYMDRKLQKLRLKVAKIFRGFLLTVCPCSVL